MTKQLDKGQAQALKHHLGKWADPSIQQTWEDIKTLNITDKELTEYLGTKWGEYEGSCGPDWTQITCIGNVNPRVWFDYGPNGKPDLQGEELLNQTRIILDMPRPAADGQLSLF